MFFSDHKVEELKMTNGLHEFCPLCEVVGPLSAVTI